MPESGGAEVASRTRVAERILFGLQLALTALTVGIAAVRAPARFGVVELLFWGLVLVGAARLASKLGIRRDHLAATVIALGLAAQAGVTACFARLQGPSVFALELVRLVVGIVAAAVLVCREFTLPLWARESTATRPRSGD